MRFILVLMVLFISGSAVGQADLISKKGSKYYYKDKRYKCKDLSVIYKGHQEALDIYNSGARSIKAANTVAYVGLGFIVLGGIGVSAGTLGGVIIGGLSITAGLVLELIGLVPRGVGNGKLKKAMRIYNYEMIERHGYKSDTSLSFGTTKNGLGLVLNF